jgi:hypothetical protein
MIVLNLMRVNICFSSAWSPAFCSLCEGKINIEPSSEESTGERISLRPTLIELHAKYLLRYSLLVPLNLLYFLHNSPKYGYLLARDARFHPRSWK